MKRSGDIRWGQLQIGVVVVAAALFLIWASMRGGENIFSFGHRSIVARFHDVKGLVVGASAKLNGYEVGQVSDISFAHFRENRLIDVKVDVNTSAWPLLRRDSKAIISAVGFFGDKQLSITAGSNDQPVLKNGEAIASSEPEDLMETFGGENSPIKQLGPVLEHLDSITAKTSRGEGSVGKMLYSPEFTDELVGLAQDLRKLSRSIDVNQQRMTSSLVRMSETVDSLGRTIQGPGSVGRALREPEMFEHLSRASARMDSMTADLNAGHGTLGKVLKDDGLYTQTQSILKEVRSLVVDMQANPRRYFKISVF